MNELDRKKEWARKLQERDEQDHFRAVRAQLRERERRWSYPGKARVIHPKHGELIVPCASPLAALTCAAEVWGVDLLDITEEGEVWACDQTLQAAPRPEWKGENNEQGIFSAFDRPGH